MYANGEYKYNQEQIENRARYYGAKLWFSYFNMAPHDEAIAIARMMRLERSIREPVSDVLHCN